MRWRRLACSVLLGVGAAISVLLAADLRSWHRAVESGDARYAQQPAEARWSASTVLPFDPALRILDLARQLAFRHAATRFVKVSAEGNGLDNGYSESAARGALETVLTNLAQSSERGQASEADNLLGILAYADSQQHGPSGPAPVMRSEADFEAAVRLDPSNTDAKFNLELLLRKLLAHGTRPGAPSSNGGDGTGHNGAAGGTPGRGY